MKYLYKSIDDYSHDDYDAFLNKSPIAFKNKVNSLVSDNSKYQRILGRILLNELLDGSYNEEKIKYNQNGKPLLDNISFNISHSYKYVLVATNENNIGVDIEKVRNINSSIIKTICNKDEYDYIINSNNPNLTFFIYYTLKEAYTKLLGTGIIDIINVHFKFDGHNYICLNNESLNIFVSTEIDNYVFAIIYE